MTIAIAGASGNFGRKTADLILERIDPGDLVLVTRDPAKLESYAARGVQVRRGDFDQPDTLAAAFSGVDRLLLVSATDIGRRIKQHVSAVEAARAAGVRHVAYTSIVNPDRLNPVVVAEEHRATEDAIRTSGMAWTLLRDAIYAEQQVSGLLASLPSGTFVHNQGDGVSAYVARDDCAAVAAVVMTTDGHEGTAYDVTGPELLTAAQTAAIVSDVTGQALHPVAVDDAAYAAALVQHAGLPPTLAASLATFGEGTRGGYLAARSDVVERLTGHPATPFADVVRSLVPAAA